MTDRNDVTNLTELGPEIRKLDEEEIHSLAESIRSALDKLWDAESAVGNSPIAAYLDRYFSGPLEDIALLVEAEMDEGSDEEGDIDEEPDET